MGQAQILVILDLTLVIMNKTDQASSFTRQVGVIIASSRSGTCFSSCLTSSKYFSISKIHTNHHKKSRKGQASLQGVSYIFQTACPWMGHTHANQWADKTRHCGAMGSESDCKSLLPQLHCVAHPIILHLKCTTTSKLDPIP